MSANWQVSPGYQFRRDWGTLAKCPHCPATNVTMTSANMLTCPLDACKRKQQAKNDRRKTQRARAAKAAESAGQM